MRATKTTETVSTCTQTDAKVELRWLLLFIVNIPTEAAVFAE